MRSRDSAQQSLKLSNKNACTACRKRPSSMTKDAACSAAGSIASPRPAVPAVDSFEKRVPLEVVCSKDASSDPSAKGREESAGLKVSHGLL